MVEKAAIPARESAIPLYTLGAIFIVPLLIGVFLVSTNVDQADQANQLSRDLASMYAQGVDFSKPSNQKIAMRVADGAGMRLSQGEGVIILSRIRLVRESDCGSTPLVQCANRGRSVITQRYVIGNPGLRPSSFGNPAIVDLKTGNVANWATDLSARAEEMSSTVRHEDYTYAAECYLATPDRGGVYSRAMF